MKDDDKKNNQVLLPPTNAVAEAEPPQPELVTVEGFKQQVKKAYAQGAITTTALRDFRKEVRRLLPILRPIHDYLSQRGINHVRGTTNTLPTWQDWLGQFLEDTGLDMNPKYVSRLVLDYDPDDEDGEPGSGVQRKRPASIRVQSGHRQTQKRNSGATCHESVEDEMPRNPGDGAVLESQLAEHGGLGDPQLLRGLSPEEVSGSLHDAFDQYAKWIRPDLKITVIVYAEQPDDDDLEPYI